MPCHRVVKSSGEIGGYRAGTTTKRRLLKKEGIVIVKNKIVNFDKYLYKFLKRPLKN
ncbi:MAG: MGMT family protein [Parcubacteria group bacterium]